MNYKEIFLPIHAPSLKNNLNFNHNTVSWYSELNANIGTLIKFATWKYPKNLNIFLVTKIHYYMSYICHLLHLFSHITNFRVFFHCESLPSLTNHLHDNSFINFSTNHFVQTKNEKNSYKFLYSRYTRYKTMKLAFQRNIYLLNINCTFGSAMHTEGTSDHLMSFLQPQLTRNTHTLGHITHYNIIWYYVLITLQDACADKK